MYFIYYLLWGGGGGGGGAFNYCVNCKTIMCLSAGIIIPCKIWKHPTRIYICPRRIRDTQLYCWIFIPVSHSQVLDGKGKKERNQKALNTTNPRRNSRVRVAYFACELFLVKPASRSWSVTLASYTRVIERVLVIE